MAKEEIMGIPLPGWLRYGLERDGVRPSTSKRRKEAILPMNSDDKEIAKQLSEEIWRQRLAKEQCGEEVTLLLRGEAVEGVEKLLWALAHEDYDFANMRVKQLINGLMKDAPLWKDGFDEKV